MTKREIITKILRILVVFSLLIIFRDVVFSIIDKKIIPLTSKVEPNSNVVLTFAVLLVISTYLANGILWYKKSYSIPHERSIIIGAIAISFYSLFRFNDRFVFYGVGKVAYVDAAFIFVAILETLSYFIPIKKRIVKVTEELNGFISDNPYNRDKLGRTDYAEILLDKICATYESGSLAEGSMTILLNEQFGAGKTTFFNLIQSKANGKIRTCVFKPWQTANGDRITEELLRLMEEQYVISSKLGKNLKAYSKLLSGSKAENLIEHAYYLINERDSLAQRFKTIKDMLKVIDNPLLVLVDDVDRLQAEELLALLKLLRNAADFPNIIYLVAADKESMSQLIEKNGIKDADLYLKKFFNFELLFPIDDSFFSTLLKEQIISTIHIYYGDNFSMDFIERKFLAASYIQSVFRNPRDVYRYINLLTYTLDLFKRYGILEEVYVPDLLKLLIIQFICPKVYKILRDEMDMLFLIRGYDGRIHLKDEYKGIIMSRQQKKQLEEMMSRAQEQKNIRKEKADDTIKDNDLTLFIIPGYERPNTEDVVSDILSDLFYDKDNYREKSRICYIGEYFKFFAGKYSQSELSAHYMRDLMDLSSESVFVEKMDSAIQQGKSIFIIHKLKQYIEDKTVQKDLPIVLKRCITIQSAIYQDWADRESFGTSPIDFYHLRQFQPVYLNLLLVDDNKVVNDKEEIKRIKNLYAENKEYAWLASSLMIPINENRDLTFVYGLDLFNELKKGLIRRFITEELKYNPFMRKKIMAIPMLRDLDHVYWDNQFHEFINNASDPMEWLYKLLLPSGDLLVWNEDYCHNLVGDSYLDSYAKDFLGLKLPEEIILDLEKISTTHNREVLKTTNFGHYPFLVAAKKWWDEKEKNASS